MCCSCAAGCGVSFVDPRYTILDDGTSNDDHPHVDIRKRDLFLYATFMAETLLEEGLRQREARQADSRLTGQLVSWMEMEP